MSSRVSPRGTYSCPARADGIDTRGAVRIVAAAESGVVDLAVVDGEIIGAEELAARFGSDVRIRETLVPPRHPRRFDRQAVGDLLQQPQHRRRAQGFLQLGAGRAQLLHVDRVEDVDPVPDERALAPVHDLVAGAHEERAAGEVELPERVEIEQVRVVRRVVDRLGTELGLVDRGLVVEIGAAREHAEIAVLDREVGRDVQRQRDEIPLAVIEIAVVGVGVARGAAVGDGDQSRVATLHPPDRADGERGVEVPVHLAVREIELERVCRRRHRERQGRRERGSVRGPSRGHQR